MAEKNCTLLLEYLQRILDDPETMPLDPKQLDEPYAALGAGLQLLQQALHSATRRQQEYAKIIEQYNQLFIKTTASRSEWIFVLDARTHQVLFCNRNIPQTGYAEASPCVTCPDAHAGDDPIFSWSGTEYESWEMEGEQGKYYRIDSHPFLWLKTSAYLHVVTDITEQRNCEEHLYAKAYSDPTTGIYNRLFFEEHMADVIREKRTFTIGYMDLDGLKYVNDHFGHVEGDQYLKHFVELIQKTFRSSDIFARIGGDEFCLVLDGHLAQMVTKKLEAARTTFMAQSTENYSASFSYGIYEAGGPDSTTTLQDILETADARMYEHKRQNKKNR
jgi:diguanylate cyclase (GGDEF)-like protein